MDFDETESGIRILKSRLQIAIALVGVYMVCDVLMQVSLGLASGTEGAMDEFAGFAALALLASLVASVISVCMWTHRANANLQGAGRALEFTPGWAVGWYFIPFANLFKPFQAMREIWNESLSGENSFSQQNDPLLTRWWGFWITGNITGNLSGGFAESSGGIILGAVSSILMIGAGLSLIQIMRQVTAAQETGALGTASVFT